MFCLHCDYYQQKKQKNEAFFDILMTITPGVNMITRKMTPFFIYPSSSISWYVLLLHFKTFCVFFLFCKIQIYMPKMTLSSLLTWISFLYTKFANFSYICSAPNLIPIWSRSHGRYLLLMLIKSKMENS